MTIRDRGKIKWQAASFIPQAFEMTNEMFKDQARQPKPILDQYQVKEFDLRIAYATEYNYPVELTAWMRDLLMKRQVVFITLILLHMSCVLNEVKDGEFERLQKAN